MLFSSLVFLFVFLPLVLVVNYLLPIQKRNVFLLVVSLVFYAWGEDGYIFLMLSSIIVNYFVGMQLGRVSATKKHTVLMVGIFLNLLPLFYFKYFEFLAGCIHGLFADEIVTSGQARSSLHLPLGISFFTFQAISYLIDLSRNQVEPQKNIINLGLYISLFPQLIAGPIVRYHEVVRQITVRLCTSRLFANGVERFTFGLSKKVLLANPLGEMADVIFNQPVQTLLTSVAWLGLVSYTLQIYYDFSGYSDMAIGLGRMLGFEFPENFKYPYIARSLREFWQRWHISLSTWFRDYLYIPLGGNRGSSGRTAFNLFVVFFLCGFWHGASWNFIIWGLLHGIFLWLERGWFGEQLQAICPFFRNLYVLLVIMIAWVFFRSDTVGHAGNFLGVMVGMSEGGEMSSNILTRLDAHFFTVMLVALVLAAGMFEKIKNYFLMAADSGECKNVFMNIVTFVKMACICFLLVASTMNLATGAYNPFIYFRF